MSRPREVTDSQIIEAARRVFIENGAQTSVARVADELGVTSTALHLRMGSKRELLLKALCPSDPPILGELDEPLSAATPVAARLQEILTAIQLWTAAEIPATFTLYSIGMRPEPGDEIDNSQPLRLRRALSGWLRRASRYVPLNARPAVVAEMLIGTLEARALHNFITGNVETARESRRFVRELVAGVIGAEA